MAATTDWGSQTFPSSLNYGDTFSSAQSQFYDDYLFNIPMASVDSITSTISLGNLGIDNLQARLYSGTLTTTGTPSGLLQAWSTPISLGGSGTVVVINPITLGAGDYILEIRGDVAAGGGSYAGVMNISAVPEAKEWALLLCGLGLFGLIAARRRRNAGVAGEYPAFA